MITHKNRNCALAQLNVMMQVKSISCYCYFQVSVSDDTTGRRKIVPHNVTLLVGENCVVNK